MYMPAKTIESAINIDVLIKFFNVIFVFFLKIKQIYYQK